MVFPWYTLFGLLFLIPFVDPRRPFRLLHLDLLVLLVTGVGALLAELGAGQPQGSLALTILGLSYLAVRFLLLGFPGSRAVGAAPDRALVGGGASARARAALRYALAERTPSDRGLATVAGADRIGKGQELYYPASGPDALGAPRYLRPGHLSPLRPVRAGIAQGSVAAVALLLAFVPRRRSVWQLTALGAGIMVAVPLTMNYWSDEYLLWLAPLAFAACFAAYDCRPEALFGLGERGKAGAASAEIADSPAEEVVRV